MLPKATNDEEADETSASAVASPKALPPKQPPPFIRPASSDRAINASQPIATSSASNAPPPLPRQPTQDGVKVASPAASPKTACSTYFYGATTISTYASGQR